jgi:hypothetical protein
MSKANAVADIVYAQLALPRKPDDNINHSPATHCRVPSIPAMLATVKRAPRPSIAAMAAMKQYFPNIDSNALPRPDLTGIKASSISPVKTIKEAISSPFGGHFYDAWMNEMDNIMSHDTVSEPISPPLGHRIINSKVVFKVKPDQDGYIAKFKARLVALGFQEVEGVHFGKTFAPSVSINSILLMIGLAAQHEWHLCHVDWIGAYLNGVMEHEVYMRMPDMTIRRLNKALYGTKQGGERWHAALDTELGNIGFDRTIADPCMYIIFNPSKTKFVMAGIHTDDGLCASNDQEFLTQIVERMGKTYELINHGTPKHLLGIKIVREGATGPIHVSMPDYTRQIVEEAKMQDCNPSSLPHQPGVYLTSDMSPQTDEERAAMQSIPYANILGMLNFLTRIRCDIVQAVNSVSEFASNPGRRHWNALKLIIKYLAGTVDHGILYHKQPNPDPVTYADSNHAGCPQTRRSHTGVVTLIAGGAIYCKSIRQNDGEQAPNVNPSSTHGEIKALCAASRFAVWLSSLMRQIKHPMIGPAIVFEDNRGAKAWSGYRRMDKRTRDIEVQYHYTREAVEMGLIKVQTCASENQLADFLSKPSSAPVFRKCINRIGICAAPDTDVDLWGQC